MARRNPRGVSLENSKPKLEPKSKRSETRSPEKTKITKKPTDSKTNKTNNIENGKLSHYDKFARNSHKISNGVLQKGAKDNNQKIGSKNKSPERKPAKNGLRENRFNNRFEQKSPNKKTGKNEKKKQPKNEFGPNFNGKKIRVFKSGDFEDSGKIIGIEDDKYKNVEELIQYLNTKIKLNHDVSIKRLYNTLGIQVTNLDKIKNDGIYVVASQFFAAGAYEKKKKKEKEIQSVGNKENSKTTLGTKNGLGAQGKSTVNRKRKESPKKDLQPSAAKNKPAPGKKGFANRRTRSASPQNRVKTKAEKETRQSRKPTKSVLAATKKRADSDSKVTGVKARSSSQPPQARKVAAPPQEKGQVRKNARGAAAAQKARDVSSGNQQQKKIGAVRTRRASDSEAQKKKSPPSGELKKQPSGPSSMKQLQRAQREKVNPVRQVPTKAKPDSQIAKKREPMKGIKKASSSEDGSKTSEPIKTLKKAPSSEESPKTSKKLSPRKISPPKKTVQRQSKLATPVPAAQMLSRMSKRSSEENSKDEEEKSRLSNSAGSGVTKEYRSTTISRETSPERSRIESAKSDRRAKSLSPYRNDEIDERKRVPSSKSSSRSTSQDSESSYDITSSLSSRSSSRSRGLDKESENELAQEISQAKERDTPPNSQPSYRYDSSLSDLESESERKKANFESEIIDHSLAQYSTPGDGVEAEAPSPAEHWEEERRNSEELNAVEKDKKNSTPSTRGSERLDPKTPTPDGDFFGRKSAEKSPETKKKLGRNNRKKRDQ